MRPFIETYSGRTFRPLTPVRAGIVVGDIAHALSNQCRYSGHTRWFYSVGEHSVRVSELLGSCGYSKSVQLWGLLHDASEAYLVDLPTPLKSDLTLGPVYKRAEKRLMRSVCKRFKLQISAPPAVHTADAVLLATEVRDLMHGDRPYWKKLTERPLPERIRPWSAAVAEYEFLRRFYALGGK